MRRFHLFTLRGVAIHVDPSFAVVALFFFWLLATSFFAPAQDGLAASALDAPAQGLQWWMGAAGVVGLAFSLVLIEVAHALAARRAGVSVHGVSLFLLGGVAEMSDEPRTPKDDLLLALAGPGASIALALSFHSVAALLSVVAPHALPAVEVLRYLGWLNVLLAAFNLLPAFPLDGGRALRALIWKKGHSRAFATELTAGFGKAFGVLFIVLGLLSVVFESILVGVWWASIGVFLRRAARRASSTLVAHEALQGERVARFIQPVAAGARIAPTTTLHAFMHDVVLRRGQRARVFPVVDGELLVGTVCARDLRRAGRGRLDTWSVQQVLAQPHTDTCIAADAPAADALRAMGKSNLDRLFVIAAGNGGDRLVGAITKDDVLAFVAQKLEVDGPVTEATYERAVLSPST
jgi:Zn-dependent protease/CBS domain-containing protein